MTARCESCEDAYRVEFLKEWRFARVKFTLCQRCASRDIIGIWKLEARGVTVAL